MTSVRIYNSEHKLKRWNPMENRPPFDEIARKLSAALPPGLKSVQEDMRETFSRLLQNAFSELNLVTREEFDVQSAVLMRTREKLEALEKRVQELEQARAQTAQNPSDE